MRFNGPTLFFPLFFPKKPCTHRSIKACLVWVHVPRHLSQMKKCDLRIMEIDIFIIPQIIQKSNQIIALLFIQNDYWLKKKTGQNKFTSILVKVLSSVACSSASSGDKGMFSSADILQIANVVHRVVYLLFLLP